MVPAHTRVPPDARRRRVWVPLLGAAALVGLAAGCAVLTPLPAETSVEQRLAVFPATGLPFAGRVTVHWDRHMIPFIEAEHDGDAAFALGLVHAHLRLGQMAAMRMIARGRVSKMIGPMGVDIDRGLRVLAFGRAAADIERTMDPAARSWVRRFVEGINHYQGSVVELPHEFRVLGLEREPWTTADVLAIGRLAGTDFNWLVWLDLLPLRSREGWKQLWARLMKAATAPVSLSGGDGNAAAVQRWLAGLSRSGSNSVAVAARRSQTGGALIANDPHLGIYIPNVWLIAGLSSPSYHVVGLMTPGLPIFAIGRNPHIAWGGTNLRAASSDLYDVSGVPVSEIAERHERIGVRWWFDSEVTVRETRWGPIVTDAPLFAGLDLPPLALKWTGHAASDEIGAMLAVSRAPDFAEFRAAFDRFALPGQTMLYADVEGNIGEVLAVRLPGRDGPPADLVLDPAGHDASWGAMRAAGDFRYRFNPEPGYLASGNNRPPATAMPIGFFFSPDDRVNRMGALIEAEKTVGIETLKALQQDVYQSSSAALRDLFVSRLDASGLAAAAGASGREAIDRLRRWDGHYRIDSVGAVTFEQFRHGFIVRFYTLLYGESDAGAFAEIAEDAARLQEDIAAADEETLRAALRAGLDAAAGGLRSFASWGDMHRLRLAHPLANLPLIGSRYVFWETGTGWSSETLMKTAHDVTALGHTVDYGSNARHISDMSDPDRNYFVLLGGQDGHIGSAALLDQTELWLEGAYIRLPLRIGTVRERFPHRTELGNRP